MKLRLAILATCSLTACGDGGGGATNTTTTTEETTSSPGGTSSEGAGSTEQSTGEAATGTTGEAATGTTGEAATTTGTTGAATHNGSSTTGSGVCGEEQQLEVWPTSGLLVSFTTVGEHAHVWITNEDTIAYVDAWLVGSDAPIGIPGGPIELDGTYNPGYSYRLVPGEVTFGDFWIELCDAAACYIEEDPQAWFDNPNEWCPWSFELDAIHDCRGGDGTRCPIAYP